MTPHATPSHQGNCLFNNTKGHFEQFQASFWKFPVCVCGGGVRVVCVSCNHYSKKTNHFLKLNLHTVKVKDFPRLRYVSQGSLGNWLNKIASSLCEPFNFFQLYSAADRRNCFKVTVRDSVYRSVACL